jgi:hypothetical protein
MEETEEALEYDYDLAGGRESSCLSQARLDLVSLDFLSRGPASRSEIVIVILFGFFRELWRSPFAGGRLAFGGRDCWGVLFAIFSSLDNYLLRRARR